MNTDEIKNIIQELVQKTTVETREISVAPDKNGTMWFSVQVAEPHLFVERDGEALSALNHLVRRIMEAKNPREEVMHNSRNNILIDINDFQKKRVESVQAVAHMMGERARYFKSSVEVDPMSPFERRIVHEFLSTAEDLKTESVGAGRGRRVVIRYIGSL